MIESQPIGSGVGQTPSSPLDEQLSQLEWTQEVTFESVERLYKRLAPAIGPAIAKPTPEAGENVAAVGNSDLVNRLRSIAGFAREINGRLGDLLDRLEI